MAENSSTKLVTIKDAAKIIGVSTATVRTLIRTGQLKGMSFGTARRFRYVTNESLAAFGKEDTRAQ